jgi:transposase
MIRDTFWLPNEQFARLESLLPNDTRGNPRVDDRRLISGIAHVRKSGCCRADAPQVYDAPHKTLCNPFVRFAAKGVWRDNLGPPAQVLIQSQEFITNSAI